MRRPSMTSLPRSLGSSGPLPQISEKGSCHKLLLRLLDTYMHQYDVVFACALCQGPISQAIDMESYGISLIAFVYNL